MYKVYFESAKGRKYLGERVNYDVLWTDVIMPLVKDHQLEDGRLITRSWINPEDKSETYIDFGSWSTYLVIKEIDRDEH